MAVASHTHTCGNQHNPVPNSPPTRYYYTGNGTAYFNTYGYHTTAGYAGGNYYGTDYTKGRAYTSSYGTCSSPRFRNHGIVANANSYSIQFGEPNPEVLSYWWPYWSWASYVSWWHSIY